MRRLLTLATFLMISLAGFGPIWADDPPPADSRIFTASDLVDDPFVADFRTGDYTFWVWTDNATGWSSRVDRDRFEFSPKMVAQAKGQPRWVPLGRYPVSLNALPAVSFGSTEGRPVPALFAISTDANFDPTRALDLIRGNVKSVAPPADPRRTTIRTEDRGADFDPPASLEAWQARASDLRDRLRVTLGLWPAPPRTDLHAEVVGTIQAKHYLNPKIDRVVLETLPGVFLAGNLYLPPEGQLAGVRHPAVLCPHGHAPEGRVNPDTQARCAELARLGCVVFVCDMVGYADGKPFGHAFMSDRLKRWGLSLAGLQTWNTLRALDYLSTHSKVDPARIAITGESGGASQTILATALDPRIKVAAPVVMVSDGYQGGCACENAPGLRWGTDNVEIAALAAPRPLKLVGATGDWTARTMTNAYPTLQLVYGRFGASDRVSADVFDFPHNYNRTSREAVYAFFGRWFLGLPAGEPIREPADLKIEAPADLLAFDSGHPYPSTALTPAALEDAAIERLSGQIDRLGPGDDPTIWAATRAALAVAHRVRVPVDPPSPRETAAKLVRVVERPRFTVRHFTVGRVRDGGLIPVVLFEPKSANPGRGALTVLSLERGKVELATPEGEPSPLVQALLDRGQSVVGFDPFLIGEAVDPDNPTAARPGATHFDTYNPSLALDRMRDLATVVSWSKALAGVVEVNLVARGHAGVLALLARPALEGLGRTVLDLDRFTYGDGSTPVPPDLDVPGLFQFGALRGAAALAAPAPLWITGAGAEFDRAWPTRAYALAGASSQLRLDRNSTPERIARWVDTGEVGP